MKALEQEFEVSVKKAGGISCILFDGQIDLTNVMMQVDGSDLLFPAKIKE